MNERMYKAFIADRDRTFTNAVMSDDWDGLKRYARSWNVPIPQDEAVMKAGVYKAVQEVTSIPQSVKDVAREKCVALGFKPTMWGG